MGANGILIDDGPGLVALSKVSGQIAAAERIILFLDFDGTVAPIVPDPDDARLPAATRAVLVKLAAEPHVTMVFISGRALKDIRKRIAIDSAIYAGNHGFEIEGRGLSFIHPDAARDLMLMDALEDELMSRVDGILGALVENKGLTLSVHYRRVGPGHIPELAKAVQEVYSRHTGTIEMMEGRKIFEFRPRVGWNKGRAADWIRARAGQGALPICLGDDRTDEDTFAALRDGITIHVGGLHHSSATYRLSGPGEVREFLERLSTGLSKIRQKGAV
jgi:trehalose 6-phosphate phosphatase